jgi:hypothetical protein
MAKERDALRREWERSEVVGVEVVPEEFARHCDETNSEKTIESLKRFAEEKGAQEHNE